MKTKEGKKMKLICRAFLVAAVLLVISSIDAHASLVSLFSDDFSSISGAWTTTGLVLPGFIPPSPTSNPYALMAAAPCPVSMITTVSTSGYENINFSYYRATASLGENPNDLFAVKWKPHGATDWIVLESLKCNSAWQNQSWLLPDAAEDSLIDIGFYLKNGGDKRCKPFTWGDFAGIDDVLITGNSVVPEPITMSLFGLGLLGFGIARNRRK